MDEIAVVAARSAQTGLVGGDVLDLRRVISPSLKAVQKARETGQERADQFVDRWQKLGQTSQRQYQAGDMSGYKATRSAMGNRAKSLERDQQAESIVRNRSQELGIKHELRREQSIARALQEEMSRGQRLSRGIGMGM